MIIVIMGISGSGKTTVGKLLAAALGLPFYDADDLHPEANKQKMAAGQPLNDNDRWPWLEKLGNKIREWNNEYGAVLACSALKESYRQKLATVPGSDLKWVLLHGSRDVIKQRMEQRQEHFFDPGLLDSQLEALEKPAYGIHVDINKSPEVIVDAILKELNQD